MFEIEEKNEKNWESLTPKNILIYGESKVGKTYAALELIKSEMAKNPQIKLYVINTDMGFSEPAKQLGLIEYKDRIQYYYTSEIREATNIISELKKKVKPQDYVLFDLVSWIWNEAQQEFIRILGGDDTVSFITNAMKDPKKFGLFTGIQWQSIKKIDAQVTNFLTRNLSCNIIGITGVKGTEMEDIMNKKTQGIYSKVGRPDGRKDLAFEFSTIIRIFRDNENYNRSFVVTGTRAINLKDFVPVKYDEPKEMWKKLEEMKVI